MHSRRKCITGSSFYFKWMGKGGKDENGPGEVGEWTLWSLETDRVAHENGRFVMITEGVEI